MSDSKIIKIDSLSLQNIMDEDSELIPLMTVEDEEEINVADLEVEDLGSQEPEGAAKEAESSTHEDL